MNNETNNKMNFQAVQTRANNISEMNFTNQLSTEKAWLMKTMKEYQNEFGYADQYEWDSEEATTWAFLLDALRTIEII